MPARRTLALPMLFAASLLAAPLAAQQKTLAERLGYPADTKLLILHADDLGAAHSVNAASLAALDKKVISSASIMMPTPWVTEVAAYARAHPDADLGLHLTLSSEWFTYRWGPIASRDSVRSLIDSTGYLWKDEAEVAKHARVEEAEREIRAQIAYARSLGINPSHLDSHMGSLFTTPDLYAMLAKVARETGIPFLAIRAGRGQGAPAMRDGEVVLEDVVQIGPQVAPKDWKKFYLSLVDSLKPGLTEMIVHLGHDDAELQAVMVDHPNWGSAWRQRDFDLVNNKDFRKRLQKNKVVLVTWRDVARATAVTP